MSRKRTIRSACLAAAAILLGFYGYVVIGLIFHPAVSQEYRMYFLETKLEFWPEHGGLDYAFGHTIVFNRRVKYLSDDGWDFFSVWGTATCAKRAGLYLRTPPVDSAPIVLTVWVRGDVLAERPVTRVRVVLNGRPVDTWNLPPEPGPADWHHMRTPIPLDRIEAGGLQHVEFVIERPAAAKGWDRCNLPRRAGAGTTAPGMGIARLTLTASPGITARTDAGQSARRQ